MSESSSRLVLKGPREKEEVLILNALRLPTGEDDDFLVLSNLREYLLNSSNGLLWRRRPEYGYFCIPTRPEVDLDIVPSMRLLALWLTQQGCRPDIVVTYSALEHLEAIQGVFPDARLDLEAD